MSLPPRDRAHSTKPINLTMSSSTAPASVRTSASCPTPPTAHPASHTTSTATETTYTGGHRSSADYWRTVLNQVPAPHATGTSSMLSQPGMAATRTSQIPSFDPSSQSTQPHASGQGTSGKLKTAPSSHEPMETSGTAGSGSFHMGPSPRVIFPTATRQMSLPSMTYPVHPAGNAPSQPFQTDRHMQTENSSNETRAQHQQKHPYATVRHEQQHANDWALAPLPPRPYLQPPAHSTRRNSSGALGSSSVANQLPSVRGGRRQALQQNRKRTSDSTETSSRHLEDSGRGSIGDAGGSCGDHRSNSRAGEETGIAPPSAGGAAAPAGPSTSRTTAGGTSPNPPKNFRCPICSHPFERRGHLEQHIDSIHNNHQRFQCPVCLRRFGHRSSMRRHMMKLHEVP